MKGINYVRMALIFMGVTILGGVFFFSETVLAQEEVTSDIRRYKQHEVSTGYYEEYEVIPRHQRPFVGLPAIRKDIFPYTRTAAKVRIRTRLADSHRGIRHYNNRQCAECHIEEAKDIHTVWANLTCRQCHGGEPIASINHIYSPINPIRRHAYICSKCHEGAGASFASYIIHEPPAGSTTARKGFRALYYAYWFMLCLLVVTLAFFIPHTFMVGLRELFNPKTLFAELISKWSRCIFGKITRYRLKLNEFRNRVKKKRNAENDGNDAH